MDIKICGIRRVEDIDAVNECMPDYIGFVFAKSRRRVSADEAAALSARLIGGIKTVGVFVNDTAENVFKTANSAGLNVIQLHGDEDEEYTKRLRALGWRGEIWKAVRVKAGDTVCRVGGADRILLDKFKTNEYGGSGETFDWLRVDIKTSQPIMLAGGLSTENVLDGIRVFKPAGVDVSSGVETDGFKDAEKMKKFVEKVRGE